MVKAPKEGMLMEKIKLTQPAAQPMNKKPNYPLVQPAVENAYHPYPVVQPMAENAYHHPYPVVHPMSENAYHHPYPVVQPIAESPYKPSNQPAGKKVTKAECESHMHRYVEIQAVDGYCYDGIVEHVDHDWVCLAVPGSVDPMRGFYPSSFYQPFDSFYPYRPRRFNRLALPLAGVTALSLLPYY
jgi:hypothetical protein